jgi:acetyl-CoA carboxylase biotin carboxylase subunit
MIKKVLVANRGEIAMRIFHTCRVMNLPTVAIYTHVDRGALHVRSAEEAYCISKDESDTSYLKPELIIEIAKKTGAAIHPGYGFLSENADFARRCEEEKVIFIGPSADMIAKLCVWGRNRESAISNLKRALREYKILGVKTTIPFHLRVLQNET